MSGAFMRRNTSIFVLLVILAPGLAWLIVGRLMVNAPNISVVFVGFTNNPVHTMQPVRVEIPQGAKGLCALFQVTNVSRKIVRFDTVGVEINDGHGWTRFAPGAFWRGVEGSMWSPNYSCLYAVACPAGLPTQAVWRIQVSVAEETRNARAYVNGVPGRQVFGPFAK